MPEDLDTDYTAGYLWTNFDASGGYEKIFFGYSEDGLTWSKLNKDEYGNVQPVLVNDAEGSDLGVRDPHIIRSAEGDKYWILGTDLHAEGGGAGGSGWDQLNASQNIVVWESTDLVNWSEPKLVYAGFDNAGCVWAPEAIYDETTGDYLVYWSARDKSLNGTDDNALRVYVCRTRDFNTFSEPKVWLSEDPESMSYYCEVIVDEAGKMNQLVRKLLTLNQIESGINRVELVDFDLTSLVKGVLHSFAIMVQQKNIEVEFDSSKKVTIRADEFMMEEVVRNYISNAINHIDGERRIAVEILQTPEKTRFSVFNTGQPIPEGELNNVWQKFYKVDKARTREYGGSGIGLSIVKAVMDSHKGTCGVYNTEDGVCFWFELKRLELPAVVTAVPQAVKPQERKFQERKFQERKSVQKRGGKESRKDTNFLFF